MNHPTIHEMMARNKQQEMWAVARRERMVRQGRGQSKVSQFFAGLRRRTTAKKVRSVPQAAARVATQEA